LNRILEKTLATITEDEKRSISRKWIQLEQAFWFRSSPFWIPVLGIVGSTMALVICVLAWNRMLKRQVARQTAQLQAINSTLEQQVAERTSALAVANDDLRTEMTERHRAHQLLQSIVDGTAATIGDDFFRSLVRHLAGALDVQYVFVTQCIDDPATGVRSLAIWNHDRICENIEYDLDGTPCEAVIEGNKVIHSDLIGAQYPKCCDLVDQDARSYVGVPLTDPGRRVIGHLVLLDVKPIPNEPRLKVMVQVFAARAGAELERTRAESELCESEQRHRTVVENVPICIHEIDLDGKLTTMNPAGLGMMGLCHENQIRGVAYLDAVADRDRDRVAEMLDHARDGTASEFEFMSATMDDCIFASSLIPLRNAEGTVTRLIGVTQDITHRKHAEQQLKHTALHDGLTGLPSRVFFTDRLDQAIRRVRHDPKQMFAVLYLDFDRFKNVNDSLGHEAGDQLLISIDERIQANLRAEDTVSQIGPHHLPARLGGDEFVVLLEGVRGSDDVLRVADRLQEALSAPVDLGGHAVTSSASIGIVTSLAN
jgi:diguanylate cyclase (GGDEF)-like protein/PAS domain S-box-containing protein